MSLPTAASHKAQKLEGFAIRPDETTAESFRRIVIAEIDRCIALLSDQDNLDVGVHETRKATKRVRAVLRIVRPAIGEPDFRDENAAVRDAARALAPLREAAVRAVTVRSLGDDSEELASAFERDAESERRRFAESGAAGPVIASFEACRARFGGQVRWEGLDQDPMSVVVGIERTYRQGRSQRRIATSFADPMSLHEWRKQVKHLRHQMEVMTPIEPAELGPLAKSLDLLGGLLGEHHDLSDLVRLLSSAGPPFGEASAGEVLRRAALRRTYLEEESFPLGRLLYSEFPADFRERLAGYWRGWCS